MLENISPERVFHYFEAISAIPRGSGNTKAVSEFCVSFAKEHSLEYKRDAIGNVIIKNRLLLNMRIIRRLYFRATLIWFAKKQRV